MSFSRLIHLFFGWKDVDHFVSASGIPSHIRRHSRVQVFMGEKEIQKNRAVDTLLAAQKKKLMNRNENWMKCVCQKIHPLHIHDSRLVDSTVIELYKYERSGAVSGTNQNIKFPLDFLHLNFFVGHLR